MAVNIYDLLKTNVRVANVIVADVIVANVLRMSQNMTINASANLEATRKIMSSLMHDAWGEEGGHQPHHLKLHASSSTLLLARRLPYPA